MHTDRLDRRLAGLSLTAVVLCLLALVASGRGEAKAVNATQARLLGDVRYLASDELQGRGIGTEGIDKAAEFIRQEFTKAGLDVSRAGGDPFQEFTMKIGAELGTPNTLAVTLPDGKTVELRYDEDFRTCSFGGSGAFEGPVVFGGYAIDDPENKYQDLENVDLKGKVVLIMRRVPQQDNPHGPFAEPHGGISRHGDLRSKVSNAFGKGAAAILFVNDPYSTRKEAKDRSEELAKAGEQVIEAAEAFADADAADEAAYEEIRRKLAATVERLRKLREEGKSAKSDVLMTFGYGGGVDERDFPILHISQNAANRMLEASLGKSLAQLEAEIDSDLKPRTALLEGVTVKGQTSVTRREAEVKNVIGVLEGEGPLADETIVVGAHYDHVGLGGEGSGSLAPASKDVHNGADDNASGTAALIELARRLAARDEKLPRRIVFIAFTAEESGLIGSARYVKEPLFPLDKTIAMFNMDMVGRLEDDKLVVFGTGTSPGFKDLVQRTGAKQKFELSLKPEGFGPSDHSSFYAKKIPVLHLFTGTHRDYHRPTDDWDKINLDGIERVVAMLEDLVVETAQASGRPEYVEVKRPETAARSGSRPYFGSIPDFGGEAKGYAISGVAPGSPAAVAGLQGGDVIVEFGDQKIGSLDDFDLALRKFEAGDETNVVVLRKGERVPLKVTLGKPR